MERSQIDSVRAFNRTVTQRIGALDEEYLARSRPLGASRLLWEIDEAALGHPDRCAGASTSTPAT